MNDRTGNAPDIDQHYFSYLMRLLRTQSGEAQVWRVSLEEPLTEQMHRFDDLHSLFTFLLARTGQDRRAGNNRGLPATDVQATHHSFGGPSGNTIVDLHYSRQEEETEQE